MHRVPRSSLTVGLPGFLSRAAIAGDDDAVGQQRFAGQGQLGCRRHRVQPDVIHLWIDDLAHIGHQPSALGLGQSGEEDRKLQRPRPFAEETVQTL